MFAYGDRPPEDCFATTLEMLAQPLPISGCPDRLIRKVVKLSERARQNVSAAEMLVQDTTEKRSARATARRLLATASGRLRAAVRVSARRQWPAACRAVLIGSPCGLALEARARRVRALSKASTACKTGST
jgi:hypothetical protein